MYRPLFRPQWPDPTTTLDWKNCTMASGAMALDFHTQGKVQKWGGELRTLSGDTVGGTGIPELAKAWSKLGYTLIDRRGHTWADVMTDLRAGRGVVLQGDYDVLTGTNTCQGTFDGDHAIYLNPQLYGSGSVMEIAVGDPLCGAFKTISVGVLKAYAEKLGRAQYGYSNPQKIFFGSTRAWPDPAVNLWTGAVRTVPFPDRTRADCAAGRRVNVRTGPSLDYKIIAYYPDGTLFVAYQKRGHWYGNKYGNRWIHDSGLRHIGGPS